MELCVSYPKFVICSGIVCWRRICFTSLKSYTSSVVIAESSNSKVTIGTKKLFTTYTFAGVGTERIGKWTTIARLCITPRIWLSTPYNHNEITMFIPPKAFIADSTALPIYSWDFVWLDIISWGLIFELIVTFGALKLLLVTKNIVSNGRYGEMSTGFSKSSLNCIRVAFILVQFHLKFKLRFLSSLFVGSINILMWVWFINETFIDGIGWINLTFINPLLLIDSM